MLRMFLLSASLALVAATSLAADPFATLYAPGRQSVEAWEVTSGDDGESHLKRIELVVGEKDFFGVHNGLKQYVTEQPERFVIFSAPGNLDLPWHTTQRKEMFIVLRGQSTLVLGDGTKKVFGQGSILIFKDNTGHGHSGKTGPDGYTAINVDLGLIAK
jgi:mannose-6-phosphate isomerase-like protein (cupin superfamily)